MHTEPGLRGRKRASIARCSGKVLRYEDGAERQEAGDQRSNAPRAMPAADAREPLAHEGKPPFCARSV